MNYKTQLNSWAMEMAIKAKAAGYEMGGSLEDLINETRKIVDFTFNPRKDLENHAADFFEMVRTAPDGEVSIDALVGTLERIQVDREEASQAYKASQNGHNKEAAQ